MDFIYLIEYWYTAGNRIADLIMIEAYLFSSSVIFYLLLFVAKNQIPKVYKHSQCVIFFSLFVKDVIFGILNKVITKKSNIFYHIKANKHIKQGTKRY